MNAEDKAWVELTLVEAERKRCVSRLIALSSEDEVAKGNNYLNDIFRLKVKVVTNGGDIEERSLIYKIIPTGEDKMPNVKQTGLFKVEARIYMETLELMEKMIRAKEPGTDIAWPKFYGLKGNCDGYLMEDLKVRGFVMLDCNKGLGYDLCKLTVRTLAKFHALAAILLDRGEIRERDMNECSNFFSHPGAEEWHGTAAESLAQAIEGSWSEEWHKYAEKLRKFPENSISKVLDISKHTKKINFMTLNHGDFWLTNFMVSYDANGEPHELKLLDFQLAFVNTGCYDLHHLFTSSLQVDSWPRIPDLLQVYHSSLVHYLQLYDYSKEVPSFDQILADYERTRLFGYGMAITMRPFFMNPPGHELLKIFELPEDTDMKERLPLTYKYQGENYLKTMKYILEDMEKNGYL